jgi:hypothetical protein
MAISVADIRTNDDFQGSGDLATLERRTKLIKGYHRLWGFQEERGALLDAGTAVRELSV